MIAQLKDNNANIARPPETMLHLVFRRFLRHKLAVVGIFVLVFLVGVCFIVPTFVDEEQANFIDFTAMRSPPTMVHPFGTDDLGRDLFIRAIYGGRISLRIGILVSLISIFIGVTVGAVAGYRLGWVDSLLMRFTEALLSIPRLFILIVLAKVIGQSVTMVTVVIGVLSWMGVSRLVRANVLSLKEQDFVMASRSIGTPSRDILFSHILPNTVAPIVVAATLGIGEAIIYEASLSFLGLGVQPPTATWGNMLNRAQSFLVEAPWIAIFPGLLILITVLCVNFIGDGLRDALDPYAVR
jgi:peptide/nickel transport system permease protein